MKKLMILLLLCHAASAVKHSLMLYFMISSGNSAIPHYVAVGTLDSVIMAYYDSTMEAPEPRQEVVIESIEEDPQQWETAVQRCLNHYQALKHQIGSFMQQSNQTGGPYIVQQIIGCEWDDETDITDSYTKYGLNGEDFLEFDVKTETWISLNPLAEITEQERNRHKDRNRSWKNILTVVYPNFLKLYLNQWKNFLNRKDVPSVSLLQKTPSSPVSCHATGFYPDRAMMFWRKDGEEIHEGVEQGEILPNHDGSFQMNVDLNISSVSPEDWRRYDCVFHLSGVEDDIITKLDEAEIRTNRENPANMTVPIIAAVVVLAVIVAAYGLTLYRKRKTQCPQCPPDTVSELSQKLNLDEDDTRDPV